MMGLTATYTFSYGWLFFMMKIGCVRFWGSMVYQFSPVIVECRSRDIEDTHQCVSDLMCHSAASRKSNVVLFYISLNQFFLNSADNSLISDPAISSSLSALISSISGTSK